MQNTTIGNTTVSLPSLDEAGVPVSTLCTLFDRAVATAPDAVALRHRGITLTYGEMGRAVSALARRLAEIVAPGDVVALVLPNSIEFHIAYFAALKALTAPALLNPLYPAAQVMPLLRELAPRAVICAPATRDTMAGLTHDLSIPALVCLGQEITVPDLVAETEVPVRMRAATLTDFGALLFSGGTTGLPKTVEHTHASLIQVVRSLEHILLPRSDHQVFLASRSSC